MKTRLLFTIPENFAQNLALKTFSKQTLLNVQIVFAKIFFTKLKGYVKKENGIAVNNVLTRIILHNKEKIDQAKNN